MASMEIRELRPSDGDEVRALWQASGVRIRPGDVDVSLPRLLSHNPGLCLAGCEGDRIVATALVGFDGRRGWLYHVATHPDVRRRGIATRIVREVEERLRAQGCKKLNLIVWDEEVDAMTFWTAIGYRRERTVQFAKPLTHEGARSAPVSRRSPAPPPPMLRTRRKPPGRVSTRSS